jgi:hypothetical protein
MREQTESFTRPALAALLTLSMAGLAPAQQAPAPSGSKPRAATTSPSEAKPDPDVAPAQKAALAWLALVDAGKFDATWDEAATSFQKGQKKADWSKGLGAARPTMGKLVSRTFLNSQIRTALPNHPPDKYITIRFTSVFEKHKNGAESVTLVKDGARGFRMMSYFLE